MFGPVYGVAQTKGRNKDKELQLDSPPNQGKTHSTSTQNLRKKVQSQHHESPEASTYLKWAANIQSDLTWVAASMCEGEFAQSVTGVCELCGPCR